MDKHREFIWLSYSHLNPEKNDQRQPARFTSHHPLATPIHPWEALKIGAATPPVLTKLGWMFLYHGISEGKILPQAKNNICYLASLMIMSDKDRCAIIYRSVEPILKPD
jgi:predicted GH43/DUF377 family glycosyl hydrolase